MIRKYSSIDSILFLILACCFWFSGNLFSMNGFWGGNILLGLFGLSLILAIIGKGILRVLSLVGLLGIAIVVFLFAIGLNGG
ncbi:hypothetical protein ACQCPQ_18725 [Priestia megaterium]|uniref:hypothetical protein n=1 Tax=Priestia megaterium TaxID=1404 RepID=UPI003D064DFB